MKLLLVLIFSFSIIACSSNQRKGDDMMEAEQYDQAVFFYEKAFTNNPDDEEIAQKLSFARSRLVAANLIEVRMFRQSNLQVKAAKKLNESLQQMEDWNIRADSAVKATIDEEVRNAASWLNKELPILAEQLDYNRFTYSLKQYNHIIDSGLNTRTIKQHQPKMIQLGKKQCQNMRKTLSPQSYFYHEALQAYCSNFGGIKAYTLSKDSTRFSTANISSSKLYINPSIGISKSIFIQTLNQQLKNNPWFSEHSNKPLRMNISGQINYKKQTKNHTFSFIYPAKKEVYEVIRDKKNPEIIKRKLVKKIPIERTIKVKGQSHIETVSHNLSLNSILHNKRITGTETKANKEHQTYAHQAYFKKKNISPLKPKYLNKKQWFSTIDDEVITQVTSDLNNAWISTFCQQNSTLGLPEYENAARCAQLKPSHPVVVNWSKNEFGLSYDELQVLIH